MTLENQVVSLELTKRLKELGVKQESLFWWVKDEILIQEEMELVRYATYSPPDDSEIIAAYTVAELGELCPDAIWNTVKNVGNEGIKAIIFKGVLFKADTEANARAKMLIYLIENGLLNQ